MCRILTRFRVLDFMSCCVSYFKVVLLIKYRVVISFCLIFSLFYLFLFFIILNFISYGPKAQAHLGLFLLGPFRSNTFTGPLEPK